MDIEKQEKKVIFENNKYEVTIGPSRILEDTIVYLVINKETNVIEAEDSMLPRAQDYAIQLDEEMGRRDRETQNKVVDFMESKPH